MKLENGKIDHTKCSHPNTKYYRRICRRDYGMYELLEPGDPKYCKGCDTEKKVEDFASYKASADGYAPRCKRCQRNHVYQIKYGITLDEYEEMWEEQEGRCYICKHHESEFDRKLAVDHNHKTDVVRRLLCVRCNMGMSLVDAWPGWLKAAARYKKEFG